MFHAQGKQLIVRPTHVVKHQVPEVHTQFLLIREEEPWEVPRHALALPYVGPTEMPELSAPQQILKEISLWQNLPLLSLPKLVPVKEDGWQIRLPHALSLNATVKPDIPRPEELTVILVQPAQPQPLVAGELCAKTPAAGSNAPQLQPEAQQIVREEYCHTQDTLSVFQLQEISLKQLMEL